jgi:uncharacterized damage-inducible protein DinB
MDLEYVLSHWKNVRAGLIETIDKFRDEELDFKPYAIGWTVRQLMLHIAHEEEGEFNLGIVQTIEEFPAEYAVKDYPTKESIKSLLESVHAPTLKYLRKLEPSDFDRVITTPWGPQYRLIEMIGHLIEHETHHRAELSLILGLLGREGFDA